MLHFSTAGDYRFGLKITGFNLLHGVDQEIYRLVNIVDQEDGHGYDNKDNQKNCSGDGVVFEIGKEMVQIIEGNINFQYAENFLGGFMAAMAGGIVMDY